MGRIIIECDIIRLVYTFKLEGNERQAYAGT
ncbi:MAG: hypothetical protein ACJAXB_001453 [Candidatus Endobugula sp.]